MFGYATTDNRGPLYTTFLGEPARETGGVYTEKIAYAYFWEIPVDNETDKEVGSEKRDSVIRKPCTKLCDDLSPFDM